jgi:uncharacterized OB-fold protein
MRRQLGSLLRQARRQQGQGSSSRSNSRQQGPSTWKLYWPPGLVCSVPGSSRLIAAVESDGEGVVVSGAAIKKPPRRVAERLKKSKP